MLRHAEDRRALPDVLGLAVATGNETAGNEDRRDGDTDQAAMKSSGALNAQHPFHIGPDQGCL